MMRMAYEIPPLTDRIRSEKAAHRRSLKSANTRRGCAGRRIYIGIDQRAVLFGRKARGRDYKTGRIWRLSARGWVFVKRNHDVGNHSKAENNNSHDPRAGNQSWVKHVAILGGSQRDRF